MADTSETRKERRASARAERQERERAEAAKAQQRKRLWQLGGAIGVVAVVIAVIVIATSGGDSTGTNAPKLRAGENVPGQRAADAMFAGIPQSGITLGNPNAPYTMMEFADLQCPFCKQYTLEAEPSVVSNYVRTGRLRIEFRNLTIIGTDSIRAAQMAGAAGMQNRLWNYADVFYANQKEENTGYVTDDFLRRIGTGVPGLDVTRAMADRGNASITRQMTQANTLASSYGVNATPTFVIGRTGGSLRPLQLNALDANTVLAAIAKVVPDNTKGATGQ